MKELLIKFCRALTPWSYVLQREIRFLEDKMLVLRSGLWDEEYYVQNSGWRRRQEETPLDHYLRTGWRLGFNPSAQFDGNAYMIRYQNLQISPLVHYLRYGKYPQANVSIPSEETVQSYLRAKSVRKLPVKKVVYTCITNGYDDLAEIRALRFTDPAWDYVCFTDDSALANQKTFGIWELRPLRFTNLDVIRNARRHKILPHLLFPEYDESLYLDANVDVRTPFLFREIARRDTDLLLPIHFSRKCLYEEYASVSEIQIIDRELGQKQIAAYREAGFPERYGLHETNLIYRRHHSPAIRTLMEEWSFWVENYTQRDQLSLSFALWKNHRTVASCALPNARMDRKNYCVFDHQGRKSFVDSTSIKNH